ncbi:MAG: hypothetical protein LQ349_009677, partial [Xanthoria aureola]
SCSAYESEAATDFDFRDRFPDLATWEKYGELWKQSKEKQKRRPPPPPPPMSYGGTRRRTRVSGNRGKDVKSNRTGTREQIQVLDSVNLHVCNKGSKSAGFTLTEAVYRAFGPYSSSETGSLSTAFERPDHAATVGGMKKNDEDESEGQGRKSKSIKRKNEETKK